MTLPLAILRGVVAARHRVSITRPSVAGSAAYDEFVAAGNQAADKSFTCPSATKLLAFLTTEGHYNATGNLSFGGSAMASEIALNSVSSGRQMYVFRLDNPPTGAQNFVFSGWPSPGNRPYILFAVALANAAAGGFAAAATSEAVDTTPIQQTINFGSSTSLGLYCVGRNNDIAASMAAAGSGQIEVLKRAQDIRATAHLSRKDAAAGGYTFSTTTDGASEATPRVAVEIAGT